MSEHIDEELMNILSCDESILEELEGSDVTYTDEEIKERLYFADIEKVLSLPAGQRVLRKWIDEALAFSETFNTEPLMMARASALRDYADARMIEVCAANPRHYLMMLVSGAKHKTMAIKDSKEEQNEA